VEAPADDEGRSMSGKTPAEARPLSVSNEEMADFLRRGGTIKVCPPDTGDTLEFHRIKGRRARQKEAWEKRQRKGAK
jgi:hypothetical protein